MPTIPKGVELTNNAVEVLNAIRNSASINYQNYVPYATDTADCFRKIGAVIMDSPSLQNEFLNVLVNRIALVLVKSKSYENPWRRFKKGTLEYGEIIEEVFVELIKPFQFDAAVAESQWMKRENPDVRSAFHVMNYRKFYKVTIEEYKLRRAFLSADGVISLINDIIKQILTSMEYDEFLVMKYMVARAILDGRMYVESISAVSAANMHSIVETIKRTSNDWEFMNTKYNFAGVHNHTDKANQTMICSTAFDASMDVNVLASAFNMDKVTFSGKRVLVDGFGKLDTARLNELFEDDDAYTAITSDEATALNAIPCVLIDDDWFMIYDNLIQMRSIDNGEGLYWQYWYHTWKTFSTSPFAQAVVFVPATPSITSVTVSPSTATVEAGDVVQLSATVVASNFAPESVIWSTTSEEATVDARGQVTIAEDATLEEDIVIKATSTYDSTKYGTATLSAAEEDEGGDT